MAQCAGRSWGKRMMCHVNRNLLSVTMSWRRLCPVLCNTSSFVILSFRVIPRIFWRFRWWNTSSLCCILFVLLHVSLAYSAVTTTVDIYNFSLTFWLMELDCHILFICRKIVAAFPSLTFMSVSTSPSDDMTLPKYVNRSTHSRLFCPRTLGWCCGVWLG